MSISALILTKNEEEMIEDCLKQLDFVDEIILLDQQSEDKTVEITQKYTKKIFTSQKESFSKNREMLAARAKGQWLLYIDADERLDKESISQIKNAMKEDKYQVFYFPRKNIILGKWLKHGGWYPDYVPRLFKKTALKGWHGEVHESPVVEGQAHYFKYPLAHFTARNLSSMLAKTIKWAKIEAELAASANHPKVTAPKIIWSAAREFTRRYFVKLGALDGLVGLVEAIYQSLHRAITLVYLWEIQEDTKEKYKQEKSKLTHQ